MTLQNYRGWATFHFTVSTETKSKILAMKLNKKMDLDFVVIYSRAVIWTELIFHPSKIIIKKKMQKYSLLWKEGCRRWTKSCFTHFGKQLLALINAIMWNEQSYCIFILYIVKLMKIHISSSLCLVQLCFYRALEVLSAVDSNT